MEVEPRDGVHEALPEPLHASRLQRDPDLHPAGATPTPALRHRQCPCPRHGHDIHLRRPAESEVQVVDAEPRRASHGQQCALRACLLDAVQPHVHGGCLDVAYSFVNGGGDRRARAKYASCAGHRQLALRCQRERRADAVAEVLVRQRRLHPRPVVDSEEQAGHRARSGAAADALFVFGSLVARPDQAKGGNERGAPWRRNAAPRGLVGHGLLDAFQVVLGQNERGDELVGRHLDELQLISARRPLEEDIVQAPGVGEESPVDDGRRRRRRGRRFGTADACGRPGVQEVRGARTVAGGVVHRDADGEATARGQQRGLQREQPAALRQRRHERCDLGDLAGLIGGEAVDVCVCVVVVVLGDGEGDGVTRLVVELVAVGRAGREADAAGERVEGADGLVQGVPEVGDDGGDVSVGGEAVEEEALDGRGVEPEDVEVGER